VTFIGKATIARLGWTSVAFGLNQALRLANNIVLARLLAPSLFGLMTIVNAIRFGVELLSDLGLGQNIVSNPKGHTPDFYDTAWTLAVARGLLLALICCALAVPAASFFEQPELAVILPVASIMFILGGLTSTSAALLQKQINVTRTTFFDLGTLTIMIIVQVGIALVTPTIWALVIGSVVSYGVALVASYLLIPGIKHRFFIDRDIAKAVIHFGKWIFLSSIIYFFAMNFDRLYFAKQISIADLGVYSIARSLSEMINSFTSKVTSRVLFPTIAGWQLPEAEVRRKVLRGRRLVLLLAAVGLGALVSLSDHIVGLLYDDRYAGAAIVLPLLLLGAWFSLLCTVNDSIMLGTARPASPALSSGAKLTFYLGAIPLAFHLYGFSVAVLVLSIGEIVRYVTLWAFSRRQHLGFGRDDLALTLIFLGSTLVFRETLAFLGLTGGIYDLFPLLKLVTLP
jgi:O-antigen/teichoic acid export membrane protein